MLWNGNYEFQIRCLLLKRIVQCFLAKPCICDTIGGRWEQLNDCFPPVTTRKWCPTRRVMSHKKVPQKEAYLGNVLILRNSFLSVGSCQKRYVL